MAKSVASSCHANSATFPKFMSMPVASVRTTRFVPDQSFCSSALYRRMARCAPSSLNTKVWTSSIVSIVPAARSTRPSSFLTGFFASRSSSCFSSDIPIEKASHRLSCEKVGREPYGATITESLPTSRTRSSFSSLTRLIEYASHRPSGDSVPEPRRSHLP